MITENPPAGQSQAEVDTWQRELQQAIHDPHTLFEMLDLPQDVLPDLINTATPFRLRVPRGYVAKMHRKDMNDPLLRQVLPLNLETQIIHGFTADPLAEQAAERIPGMLHKYHGRILLVTTGACAIHCRYCFRQHFPYQGAQPLVDPTVLTLLREDKAIHEVILSGGDPLMFNDEKLGTFIHYLDAIPHLKRLRIHTRLPIVLPSRITPTFVNLLNHTRLQTVIVVHANHPREIDAEIGQGLQQLVAAGVTLLNQAVLLRGVNDDVTTLVQLSETLFAVRVMPYYLNLLDRVRGAAHFEVPLAEARALVQQLRSQLSGYLVPQLVREVIGGAYKQPVV